MDTTPKHWQALDPNNAAMSGESRVPSSTYATGGNDGPAR